MKKFVILLSLCMGVISLTSCSTPMKTSIIPRAVNTMNVATLSELNLNSSDYTIFNTVEATSTIYYEEKGNTKTITDENEEFKLKYVNSIKGGLQCYFSGVLKYGFFGSDYNMGNVDIMQPEEVARRLAIYRAMNLATSYGADALVEPTISTNVSQDGKKIVFQTTVVAKLLKIKSIK